MSQYDSFGWLYLLFHTCPFTCQFLWQSRCTSAVFNVLCQWERRSRSRTRFLLAGICHKRHHQLQKKNVIIFLFVCVFFFFLAKSKAYGGSEKRVFTSGQWNQVRLKSILIEDQFCGGHCARCCTDVILFTLHKSP